MDEHLQILQQNIEAITQHIDADTEFWFARDLQNLLGYSRWENFQTAINRAIESCENSGYTVSDHFRGVTKMIELAKSAKREIAY